MFFNKKQHRHSLLLLFAHLTPTVEAPIHLIPFEGSTESTNELAGGTFTQSTTQPHHQIQNQSTATNNNATNADSTPILKYLRRLGCDETEVILEFARLLLLRDPLVGIQVFVGGADGDDDEASMQRTDSLAPNRILEMLAGTSVDAAIEYLEYRIYQRNDVNVEFHDKFILLLLDGIVKGSQVVETNHANVHVPAVEKRQKLRRVLELSGVYRAERMLTRFPPNGLN